MPNVYDIDCITDNPLFEGLQLDFRLVETNVNEWRSRNWQPPRFFPTWKIPKAAGNVRRFNDYPCINLVYPAFSERAVDLLRDLLEPNGELLPVRHSVGQYYFFNCTRVVDCADLANSKVNMTTRDGFAVTSTSQLALLDERLEEELTVFKIRTQFLELFCTDRFVQRVTNAGLQGFLFPRIWPPPEGKTFSEESTGLQRAAEKWKPRIEPELDIAGNSVVIRLYHDRKRASKQELATAEQLAEDLEKRLYDENQLAAESYYGNVERTEECDFEVRVYLTAPDCDRLIMHLLPLLKCLPWPGKYHVVKKRSEYMVENAPEEYVRLD